MHIKEIHEILQNMKNERVTQNDIARAIGTSRANVSKLFAKNSFLNEDKISKIEKYFEVKFDETKDFIEVDYYPDTLLSKNGEQIEFSKRCAKCKMPPVFFTPDKNATKYIMCHMQGESMYPLIWDNDIVIIECIENTQILNNKIYAFIYEDNFYINRLSKNINQYIIQSENKTFQTQYIDKKEMSKVNILGRVIYTNKTQSLL